MKLLLLLAPIFLFSFELPEAHLQDVPSIALDGAVSKNTFTYLNPGVTTWVPGMFETQVGGKTPGLPSMGHRPVSASDRLSLLVPDVSIGKRSLATRHVFDRSIGMAAHPEIQSLYVQGSYLFFPTPSKYFYFGAGLTCGLYHVKDSGFFPSIAVYANVPLTVGYQFPLDKKFQFAQLQVTPFGTATASYGFGF
jgi:hypothetical protein